MSGSARGQRRVSSRRGARVRRVAGRGHLHRGSGSGFDGRIRVVRFLVLVVFLLIGSRAVALASSNDLNERAQQQQTQVVELPAHRGAILDRAGRELAVGTPQQTVFASPSMLDDPIAAAGDLSTALRITKRRDKLALLRALSDESKVFTFVARKVDPGLAKDALALQLPGVGAFTEESRSYPTKGSAAQVIGFAGVDNRGLEGIELQYDTQLAGKAGSQDIVRDPAGHLIKTISRTEPVAGVNVRLTLDADIQYYTEDVLAQTVRESKARSAVAIVMDPRSGAVLTMANVPVVKGHVFGRTKKNDRNRCVTDMYEPGSIFKMVTVAGALEDGVVKPTSKFSLPSSIWVADREINESHARETVTYSVAEILQWSSNVGAVKIAQKMGKTELAKWIDAFGFGAATGIELPGEIRGWVPAVEDWSDSSIGNIPMGQGVAVTPLQLVTAVCAIANDGIAVPPTIVTEVGDVVTPVKKSERVISAKVAREVRAMLRRAVDAGTGAKAQIEGYRVAGKTGTSQKPLGDGSGYSRTNYIASFAGMVPANKPRLVVLVAVDEPRGGSFYGGDIAAPAAQKIMSFALQSLEIAP